MRIEDVDILELIQADVHLTRTSPSFQGGQWSGKCPFPRCGSEQDAFNVWPNHTSGRGRFWCRRCGVSGDAINYVQMMDNLSFPEACDAIKVTMNGNHKAPRPTPNAVQPPPVLWQQRGLSFISYAEDEMWKKGNDGHSYLREGGLADATIKSARVGWSHKNHFAKPSYWGLEGKIKVACHRGVVFPQFAYGSLWGVKIRLIPEQEYPPKSGNIMKYSGPRGSVTCLNGMDEMRPGFPTLLTEGDRDRLLVKQELGSVVDPVTCGGSQKTIPEQAIAALLHCPELLIAYDGDLAGLLGQGKILEQVAYKAHPMRLPQGYDLTSLHQSGADLRVWFANGIGSLLGMPPATSLDEAIKGMTEKLNLLKQGG